MDSPASWEPMAGSINELVRKFLAKICQVWDEMGLSEESKEVRFAQVSAHIQELVGDMLSEAEVGRNNLLQEVRELMTETQNLSKDLQAELRTTGYENLPFLEVKTKLLGHLQKLRLLKEQRLNFTRELLKRECETCKVLGMEPRGMSVELPSENELKSFRLYLDKIEAEKTRMEATFKDSQIVIIEMMDELCLLPSVDFEDLVYNKGENFVFNTENMAKLKELQDRLKQQIEEAKQEAEQKIKKLQDLWKYLEEPVEKFQRFLDSHTGYSLVTLKAFDEEIKRCQEKRNENIAKYVAKVRSRIETLWDQCQIGDEERQAARFMQYQVFTEDLLDLHEMEAEKLQKYYRDNRAIFELLEVRDSLWLKMENLEQRANDPNRFHNRGGQLLAEEKERKVIQKKLPKIEEEILVLINDYELKNGKPFSTNGVPLGEALKRSWADYAAAKQTMIMARKQARDQSGISKKTPLSVSKRTPSGMSMRRRSPAASAQKQQQADVTPYNASRKRRIESSGSNRATRSASKIKRRNYRASRRIFRKSINTDNENQILEQIPASSSTSISSYGEFQEHLENREELRSSVLPRQVLKSANHKASTSTRIKTPMKPIRKNFTAAITPRRATPNKLVQTPRTPRTPNSPKTASTSRLAPAPGTLPFIF